MPELSEEELEAPKFEEAGRNLKQFFTDYPAGLIIIGIIVIGLVFLFPIQTSTFIITVGVSVLMAWLNFRIMESSLISMIDFTATEKALISGGVAGTTGYLVGTWFSKTVVPQLNWSPLN